MEEGSPRLLDFDPNRTAVAPKDAASVIVLRRGDAGLEVFCVRRHGNSAFLGGAVVFPGGKVDAPDAAADWDGLAGSLHPRAGSMVEGAGAVSARAVAVAACRETLEEGGILPVEGALGAPDLEAMRAELRGTPLAALLARRGLRLALDRLVPWARWVTPEAETRRFDARFFLLELPDGQVGTHDRHETTMSFWARPTEVLDRFTRGECFLAPPTTRTLELLAHAQDVPAAFALADAQSLRPICPRFVADDTPYLALPGDPSHEIGELRVHGPTRFVLRDGRFVSEDAPSWQAPNSQRIEMFGVEGGGSEPAE